MTDRLSLDPEQREREKNPMLTRKPHKSDLIRWPNWPLTKVATVVSTPEGHDNLCWIRVPGRPDEPFIWRFREGLNTQAEIVEQ